MTTISLRPILYLPQRGEVEPRSGSGGGDLTARSCSRYMGEDA